jgi:putative PEP-CTERM system histidine kinase
MGPTVYRAALFATTAAAYTVLFVLLLLSRRASRTRSVLLAACAGTGGSAIAIAAGFNSALGPFGAVMELACTGTWCLFVLHLTRKQLAGASTLIGLISGCGILIGSAVLGFDFFPTDAVRAGDVPLPITGEFASRLALSVYGILLTENLYRNTEREALWHVNLLCVALCILFAYGFVLYADALLFRRISPLLWDGRAVAFFVVAPLLAVSAARNPDWAIDIHVSRAAVFHTATLIGSGIFLLALALTGQVIRAFGPSWGDLAETSLILAGIATLGALLTSGSVRSRLRWLIAENFFSHRYDYRREWIKSSEILSARPDQSVQTRVIRAVAEIADSPAGLLCVRDLDGTAFQWAGSWNLPALTIAEPSGGSFIGLFRSGSWVIELEHSEIRPTWLGGLPYPWLAVPLAQQRQLIGFVVLVRPRAPKKPDRETFDLLRIVASQAAVHVAERRYAQALSEAVELRDYGKRFAFVAHDMKNVASQLKMIVHNARSHQGDPEFHKDVIITVRGALERLNGLLEILKPGRLPAGDTPLVPLEMVREEVAAIRRSSGVDIGIQDDGRIAAVAMGRAAFRSVIVHLCENAVEACEETVQIRIRHEAMHIQIDVVDDGHGMTPEFIRDKLFQPFGSTKGGGFGIGAFQARELVRAIGGDLFVISRPGKGTTMRVVLPCAAVRSEIAQTASHVEVHG